MRRTAAVVFTLFSVFGWNAVAQDTKASGAAADVAKACFEDCKDAINAAPEEGKANAAHNCAEKKGRLNKAFKKSKCWEVNEVYEKEMAAQKK
jgi:hypothetical protein